MQETAVDNPYGLGALIANGDIIARSILVILLIMSLLTWFIMITKFFDQRRTRLQAIAAEREFWSSSSLTDAISKLKGNSNPFRALAETGKQAYEYHETNKTRLSGAIGTSEWITESLQRTADTVISRMQSGLPVLASVGATAPFVGLLGTVIGIYHALTASQRRMVELHGGRLDSLEVSPNLWAGVGLVRGGAGTALVGSHTEVADRIAEYHALGIDEFILSGYPHLEEAYQVGEGVMPELRRRGLL